MTILTLLGTAVCVFETQKIIKTYGSDQTLKKIGQCSTDWTNAGRLYELSVIKGNYTVNKHQDNPIKDYQKVSKKRGNYDQPVIKSEPLYKIYTNDNELGSVIDYVQGRTQNGYNWDQNLQLCIIKIIWSLRYPCNCYFR